MCDPVGFKWSLYNSPPLCITSSVSVATKNTTEYSTAGSIIKGHDKQKFSEI